MKALNILIGFVVWFLTLIAIGAGGYYLYTLLSLRPVLLSLALQFPEKGSLDIEGRAFMGAKPVSDGRVKLSVHSLGPPLQFTLFEEIRGGHFSVSLSPYLSPLKMQYRMVITAEAQVPHEGRVLTGRESVYWNVGRWVLLMPRVVI